MRDDCDGKEKPASPPVHQVTPEMMARGNELLREAAVAKDRGMRLRETVATIEKEAELAWQYHDHKIREARFVFTGLRTGY